MLRLSERTTSRLQASKRRNLLCYAFRTKSIALRLAPFPSALLLETNRDQELRPCVLACSPYYFVTGCPNDTQRRLALHTSSLAKGSPTPLSRVRRIIYYSIIRITKIFVILCIIQVLWVLQQYYTYYRSITNIIEYYANIMRILQGIFVVLQHGFRMEGLCETF